MAHKIVELSDFNKDTKLLPFWRYIKSLRQKRIILEIPNAKQRIN